MPRHPILVVGAAIVDDLGHPRLLLAARRTEPEALAGGWEFAGGKVEPGEDPVHALHREIREELGVTLTVGEHLAGPLVDGAWPLGDEHRIHVWVCAVAAGVPQPLEDHDELRWLDAESLDAVPWLPGDVPIVRVLETRLRAT